MTLTQVRDVDFGSWRSNATGSSGVGYTLIDGDGATTVSRTTTSVIQTAPGIYSAKVSFPVGFRGQIVWDTGSAFSRVAYAVEQFNIEENNPNVDVTLALVQQMSGTLSDLYDIQYGRWKIVNNQMIFYKEDNATEVARFNLFDENGNPSMDAVFDRQKV